MRLTDVAQFATGSLRGSPTRTLLMMLAMSIGVAAVVVLTALGEGARRYVIDQFSSLGTNLVIVLPGRTETAGIGPGMLLGQIPREITLDDAEALLRSRAVKRIAPLTVGSAMLSHDALNREVVVAGSTSDLLEVRHMSLGLGKFLPPGDIHESASVCVLGNQMKRELFGNEQAVGQWVRFGDRRFPRDRGAGTARRIDGHAHRRTGDCSGRLGASVVQHFRIVSRADRGEEPRIDRTGQA